MLYRLVFIALIACTFSIQAFAQAPAPTPKDLCTKAPEAERAECEAALTEMQTAMGSDLWTKFSTCAATKDFSKNKGEDVMPCLTPDIIEIMMAKAGTPPTPSTPAAPPANGSFYIPEELCTRAEDKDRAECTKGLSEIKAILGDAYWTAFAACAVTKDFKEESTVMTCFTPDMMKLVEEAMKKEMEKAMKEAEGNK
jgi:hypothetical protein